MGCLCQSRETIIIGQQNKYMQRDKDVCLSFVHFCHEPLFSSLFSYKLFSTSVYLLVIKRYSYMISSFLF